MNEAMVETSFTSLTDSDIVLFLIEATSEDIGRGDRIILDKIKESKKVKYLESPPALNAENIMTLNNLKAILIERTLTIDVAR